MKNNQNVNGELNSRYSNTGVTTPLAKGVKFDWLTVTYKIGLYDVLQKFKAKGLKQGKPSNHYDRCLQDDRGIQYLWHSTRGDMGVCVIIAGSTGELHNPEVLFAAQEGKVTRLDVALDSDDRTIFEKVWEYIIQGKYCSKYRTIRTVEQKKKGIIGRTVYLGSRKSEKFIRIYDKGAEQLQKGKKVEGTWIRYELELKGSCAKQVFEKITSAAKCLAGALRAIKFVDEERTRKYRCSECEWWVKFCGEAEYIKTIVSDKETTIEEKVEYLKTYVSRVFFNCVQEVGMELVNVLLEIGHAKEERLYIYEL